MTSTALHPHLHFTTPKRRMLLILLGALALALAAVGTWVAVDRNSGSRVPAITGDGVPLWPPISPPWVQLPGTEFPRQSSWQPYVLEPALPPAAYREPGIVVVPGGLDLPG
jgi:hypothetical protein